MDDIPETETVTVFRNSIVLSEIIMEEEEEENKEEEEEEEHKYDSDYKKLDEHKNIKNSDIVLPNSLIKSNIPWYVRRATIMASSPRVGVAMRDPGRKKLEKRRGTLLSVYLKYEANEVSV